MNKMKSLLFIVLRGLDRRIQFFSKMDYQVIDNVDNVDNVDNNIIDHPSSEYITLFEIPTPNVDHIFPTLSSLDESDEVLSWISLLLGRLFHQLDLKIDYNYEND